MSDLGQLMNELQGMNETAQLKATIHHQESVIAGLVDALRVCRTLVSAAQHIPNNYPMTESQSNRFNQALAKADIATEHALKDPTTLATSWEEKVKRKAIEGEQARLGVVLAEFREELGKWSYTVTPGQVVVSLEKIQEVYLEALTNKQEPICDTIRRV